MIDDARFEDAGDRPLQLIAQDPEDLQVIASLVQDAVLPGSEMSWRPAEGQLALLVNRLRWEDEEAAKARGRAVERVQSLLVIDLAKRVASQGLARGEADTVLSVLSMSFEPTTEPGGHIVITFAGDGALRAEVEALEVRLRDVTRPYAAVSGKAPRHPE